MIVVASIAMNGGNSEPGTSNTATESNETAESTEETVLTIGDTATDDETFAFTVNSFECGIESVGDDILGAEAQGQFCKANITIENVGTEAEYVYSDSQILFDDQGREFSPDSSSMMYLEDSSDLWLNEINPGNSVTGDLLFDVSDDFVGDRLELHATMFSGGVEISIK